MMSWFASLLDTVPTQDWLCYFPLCYNEQQRCAVQSIKFMTNINEVCVCVGMFQPSDAIVSAHSFFPFFNDSLSAQNKPCTKPLEKTDSQFCCK